MKWSIVTDSSCEYIGKNTDDLVFEQVPFIISIDEKDYLDDASLCVEDMIDAMEQSSSRSFTACPSPGTWYEKFLCADRIIAITISSGVSGSYNSAVTARDMILEQYPDKKIFILDSLSAGSALSLFARKAESLINKGHSFEEITSTLRCYVSKIQTLFALSSFGNLVKNGRIPKIVGFIAGKLNIWGIGGASKEGTIELRDKVRGSKKVLSAILEDMKKNEFCGGHVIITHCQNIELASKLEALIKELWDQAQITILTTGGLCSYYAERGGLIIAY